MFWSIYIYTSMIMMIEYYIKSEWTQFTIINLYKYVQPRIVTSYHNNLEMRLNHFRVQTENSFVFDTSFKLVWNILRWFSDIIFSSFKPKCFQQTISNSYHLQWLVCLFLLYFSIADHKHRLDSCFKISLYKSIYVSNIHISVYIYFLKLYYHFYSLI